MNLSSVYADGDNYVNSTLVYTSGMTNSEKANAIRAQQFICYYEGQSPYYYTVYTFGDSVINSYYFHVGTSFYTVIDNTDDVYYRQGVYNNNTSPMSALQISTLDSTYNLKYCVSTVGTNYTYNISSFNTLEEGLSYTRNYINNSAVSNSGYTLYFLIQYLYILN